MNKAFEKIKVSSAEIVVHGTSEKPYYEIKYYDILDGKYHIGYSSYDLSIVFGWLKECFEIVQEVAEEYNGGWVPCSKRLPQESGYYLVTYHEYSDGNFLPKYDDIYVRRLHYQKSEQFVGWNYPRIVDDRAENDCHKEVIAWMPLPEPFKERD